MLIVFDQVDFEAQDENFKPPFLVGAPEVLDPYENVMLPSYGLTDQQSDSRIRDVYRLWRKSDGVSGGSRVIEIQ